MGDCGYLGGALQLGGDTSHAYRDALVVLGQACEVHDERLRRAAREAGQIRSHDDRVRVLFDPAVEVLEELGVHCFQDGAAEPVSLRMVESCPGLMGYSQRSLGRGFPQAKYLFNVAWERDWRRRVEVSRRPRPLINLWRMSVVEEIYREDGHLP